MCINLSIVIGQLGITVRALFRCPSSSLPSLLTTNWVCDYFHFSPPFKGSSDQFSWWIGQLYDDIFRPFVVTTSTPIWTRPSDKLCCSPLFSILWIQNPVSEGFRTIRIQNAARTYDFKTAWLWNQLTTRTWFYIKRGFASHLLSPKPPTAHRLC